MNNARFKYYKVCQNHGDLEVVAREDAFDKLEISEELN